MPDPILEGPAPRLFGLPPGVDFTAEVVRGLEARLAGHPPEAWARVTLFVPTRRMERRLREAIEAGPARLLPRIRLLDDLGLDPAGADLPPPVAPLRRRLELSRLVAAFLAREPGAGPRLRAFDLASSLADLMEEMQGEGVPPQVLHDLDVSDLSGHWARALSFLRIVEPWFADGSAPDAPARQRLVAERLARAWLTDPPPGPVVVAGSTGSRGATALLMRAVARLPQGACILPGHDFDLPDAVWARLEEPLTAEDHPQYRIARHLAALGLEPGHVRPWTDAEPPCPARARLISLSLRPPPVTDQWMAEGPRLGPLGPATAKLTLVEAPSPRLEAEAIALRLRQAVEDGDAAALVTPDRTLARLVAAALDRWDIVPDDSAGLPLHLSPPGRLLRQVGTLRGERLTGEALLALLKHPLVHAGSGRGAHLARTHALELRLRRRGPAFPDARALRAFAESQGTDPGCPAWAAWLGGLLDRLARRGDRPLADHLTDHLALAEDFSGGSDGFEGTNPLWREAAGRAARAAVGDLARHADAGGVVGPRDHAAILDALLAAGEVRDRDRGHPLVLIWGTLEARVQGAALVILGGMNEGTWPAAPPPDPWLNRRLRAEAGLTLPERRIGEAAHDYMQALGAPEAWITRATRSDDAPTTASRWVNRLVNLLDGLPDQGGPEALRAMRERGAGWLGRAAALSRAPSRVPPAPRPSPRPPVHARPTRLSVTAVERLIRDPYSVYAAEVLRLRALDALTAAPDAPTRGTVMHKVFERFVPGEADPGHPDATARLMACAAAVLDEHCAWPVSRRLWLAHVGKLAGPFLGQEAERRRVALPAHVEVWGEVMLAGVTIVGKADRIDRAPDGRVVIIDYKTGKPPSAAEQKAFGKQLLIEAAMAEAGAFKDLGAVEVMGACYVGLGTGAPVVHAPLAETPPAQVWAELAELLAAWADPSRGYSARIANRTVAWEGDHDHLARYGEWDESVPATAIDL